MSRKSRWSRLLAFMLTFVMVLSNQAVTAYADVIGGVTQPKKLEENNADVFSDGDAASLFSSGETAYNQIRCTLDEAKNLTLKLEVAAEGTVKERLLNSKINVVFRYLDINGKEISPSQKRDFSISNLMGGYSLRNDLQNINNPEIASCEITLEKGELDRTFFDYSSDGPSINGSEAVFTLEKIQLNPDGVWQSNGYTYVAIGPNHQYTTSGPLGLASEFHIIGFSSVHNTTHTNGNILTDSLTYGSNFGTNGLTGEISYIRNFDSVSNGAMCGDDDADILVVGKDVVVDYYDSCFHINGMKLDRPRIIYQDTEDYSFIDIAQMKTNMETLNKEFASYAESGTELNGKVLDVTMSGGMAVLNISAADLNRIDELEIRGLSSDSTTSVLINVLANGNENVRIPGVKGDSLNNSTGEVTDFSAGKIIWNVINSDKSLYTGYAYNDKAALGTVILPDGTFDTKANWNGTMIADHVKVNAESHRTDFTGTLGGFQVRKVLEKEGGWSVSDGYVFKFRLSAKEGTPMPAGAVNRDGMSEVIVQATASNKTPGFGNIKFGESDVDKTYTYTISEIRGNIENISYSKVVYTVEVSVGRNDTGLTLTRRYSTDGGKTWNDQLPNEFLFTNKYSTEQKASLKLIKSDKTTPEKLAGAEFDLYKDGKKIKEALKTDRNGEILVEDLEPGTYYFVETKAPDGYKLPEGDAAKTETVTIKETDKGLVKTYSVTNEKTEKTAAASYQLPVTKQIKGISAGDKVIEREFSFTLQAVNESNSGYKNYNADTKECSVPFTKEVVKITGEGSEKFPAIYYDKAGTYEYTLKENDINAETHPGYTKDSKEYKVTIKVEEKNGTLEVTNISYVQSNSASDEEAVKGSLSKDDSVGITFINTYTADGSVTLSGTKSVEGGNQKDGFQFSLYEGSELAQAGWSNTNATARTEKNPVLSADGKFAFDIHFTMQDLAVYGNKENPEQITGYDASRDFTFFVRETGDSTGYTNKNDTYYEVTYRVSDNGNGTLKTKCLKVIRHYKEDGQEKTQDVAKTGSVDFVNRYEAQGSITVEAGKALTGKEMTKGQFRFNLRSEDAPAYDKTVSNGDAKGASAGETKFEAAVTFPELSYTMEDLLKKDENGKTVTDANDRPVYETSKTFTYLLTEVIPETKEEHYTYDESVYEVQVTVTDNHNGTLSVTKNIFKRVADEKEEKGYRLEAIPGEAPVFENYYTVSGSLKFAAEKVLNGQNLKERQFTFELTSEDDDQSNANQTIYNKANGMVEFAALSYDQNDVGKTYHYSIREKTGNDTANYVYDNTEYKFEVSVIDEGGVAKASVKDVTEYGAGAEKAQVNEDSTLVSVKYLNKYLAKGEVVFTGNKMLTGNRASDIAEGEFKFEVRENGRKVADGVTSAGSSAADIIFDAIRYEITENTTPQQAADILRTHTYTVKEVKGENSSIIYSDEEFTVTVEVTDQGNGVLGTEILKITDKSGKEVEAVTFTNSYEASGKAVLETEKLLNGRNLVEGEFIFQVYEVMEDGTKALVRDGNNNSLTASNGADGKVTFPEIAYTQEDLGTHNYEIVEAEGSDPAVTYDKKPVKAAVTVEDKNSNGTLDVTVTYPKNDHMFFTNEYHADGEFVLENIRKTLEGSALTEGQFTFQLKDADGKVLQTVSNKADGKITFDPLKYTEKDINKEYTYTVSEVSNEAAGITFDETVYTIKVKVEDDSENDGKLKITSQIFKGEALQNAATFINTYQAKGELTLAGSKTLTGKRAEGIAENEFRFVAEENGVVVAEGKTAKGENSAEVLFDTITYEINKDTTKEEREAILGTHTYTVKEVKGTDTAISYSDAEFTVTAEVTDDGKGKLNAEITGITDKEGNPVKEVSFENRYYAVGAATLETTKVLNGKDTLSAGEFLFQVYEVMEDGTRTLVRDRNNNPLTASNGADGKVTFPEIAYTQDNQGVHNYEIVEVKGNDTAVTYDTEPVKATVTVEDKESNGILDVTVTYPENDHMFFTNEYHANGSVTFTGRKELLGNRGQDIKDGEFTFSVKDKATGEEAAAGKVTDGGIIEFTTIQYTEADKGTHTYVITENAGNDKSIQYQTEPVEVTVEVTDNADGTLEATAVYPENGVVFINKYHAQGEFTLGNIRKTLEGSTLTEGQFTFQLKDADGKVLQTASNKADGTIAFEPLKYTEEDINKEYTYTVSEVNSEAAGITFDETIYTIKVKVEDSEESNGTLKVTAEILKGTDVQEEMTFTNRFAGSVVLTKTGTDARILAGAQYQLYAKTAQADAENAEWEIYTADTPDGIYTTDAEGEVKVENLPANDYYFAEVKAPDGYLLSDEVHYFTIGEGEKAVVDAKVEAVDEVGDTGSIQVTKKVTGVVDFDIVDLVMEDATFYVNLFTDPEGTKPYRNEGPKAIHLKNASSSTVTFENVAKGIYYVFETDADGNVIPMDELTEYMNGEFVCMVDGESNEVLLNLETEDKTGYITLDNCFYTFPEGATMEAWIEISKTVLKNGVQTTVDDTFYAGIFTMSEDGSYELYQVVELVQNDVVRVQVPLGGENGTEPMTYYVYETDETGEMIDPEVFEYGVSGEGEVTVTPVDNVAKVDIINEVTESQETSLILRKVDQNHTGLAGASFRLSNADGEVVEEWVSDEVGTELVLEPGTYTLDELEAPEGYKGGDKVVITVSEDGEISIDSDTEYTYQDHELEYVNRPLSQSTVTPTPYSNPGGKEGPRTGDDTPIGWYLLLLFAAAGLAGGTVYRKKKISK